MSTRLRLQNQLKRRVSKLANVHVAHGVIGAKVYVSDKNGETPPELIEQVRAVTKRFHAAGSGIEILPYANLCPDDIVEVQLTDEESSLASLGHVTDDGFRENLTQLFPEITRLRYTFGSGEKSNEVALFADYVEAANADELDKRLVIVASELLTPGWEVKVSRLPVDNESGTVSDRRRPAPKTNLNRRSDRDQKDKVNALSRRIIRQEVQPLPFKLDPSRVLVTSSSLKTVPLFTLVPFYDHIFVEHFPPNSFTNGNDYCIEQTGLSLNDYLSLVRSAKVIPIFYGSYGAYPQELVEPILSDVLIHVGPGDLTLLGLSAASRWNSDVLTVSGMADELWNLSAKLMASGDSRDFLFRYAIAQHLESIIDIGDDIIPAFVRAGYLATASFTPVPFALDLAKGIQKLQTGPSPFALSSFQQGRLLLMTSTLGLNDALGATLCDASRGSANIVGAVSKILQSPNEQSFLSSDDTGLMTLFLSGMGIAYSDEIDIKSYADLFNAAEVRRMRVDLMTIMNGDTDLERAERVRQLVADYNREIRGFSRAKFTVGEKVIDVTGTLITGNGQGASWPTLALAAIHFLAQNVASVGASIDRTKLGDLITLVQAKATFRSPRAIRLHKIRDRLGR